MATIVTRAGKGSPLTHDEVDDNFSNLNTDKVETSAIGTAAAADTGDFATAAQGTTADAALPRTGGAMTGAITTNSTFDGRDVATDGTKLDGIEAGADVTDTANVTAAGALMDSELTDIAAVKALDQGVATTDSPSFAGLTVDTDTLYVDSTNNRVGIGTDSPSEELHVVSGDGTTLRLEASNTGNSGGIDFYGKDDGGTTYQASTINSVGGSGSLEFQADPTNVEANSRIVFEVDGTEHVRIDDSGFVGIGTTSAAHPLHIVDNAAAPLTVERTNSSNTSIKVANDTNAIYMGMTGGGEFAVDDDTNLSTGPWFKVDSSGTATATAFSGDGSALTNLPVSVAVYVDAAGGASADSTSDTVVPATTAEIEDTSNYSNTSGVVTVTDAGTYCVKGNVGITSTTSNYRWTGELSIVKNGATVVGKVRGAYLRGNGGSNDSYIHIDKMLSLAASDTIQLKVKRINNTSGNATFLADVSTLQLQKL